jgi:hypothetical protein
MALRFETGKVGLRQLARELSEKGYPSPIEGLPWRHATVRDILANPIYKGASRWNYRSTSKHFAVEGGEVRPKSRNSRVMVRPTEDHVIVAGGEGMIPVARWNKIQRLLAAAKFGKRKAKDREKCPLTGLLFCSHCGKKLTGDSHRGRMKYTCSTYNAFGTENPAGCGHFAIRAEEVFDHLRNLSATDFFSLVPGLAEATGGKKDEGVILGKRPELAELARKLIGDDHPAIIMGCLKDGQKFALRYCAITPGTKNSEGSTVKQLEGRIAADLKAARREAAALNKKKRELDVSVSRLARLLRTAASSELEIEYQEAVRERQTVVETLARGGWAKISKTPRARQPRCWCGYGGSWTSSISAPPMRSQRLPRS